MTETASADAAPDALAGVLRDAPFVRLVARDDGDSLAAAALLARALRARSTPFQARVAAGPDPTPSEEDVSVTVGADAGPHAVAGEGRPASTTAFAVARELGADPDPVLALAGVVAAGSVPGTDGSGDALAAAERTGRVERRPGVAVPTADLADGLSASTLLRLPYSGEPESARAALAELSLPSDLDADAHRRLASLVAVDAATAPDASRRAATAVERALRPYATDGDDAPFATVGGYADVLDALSRAAPGTGIALALADEPSDGLRTAALDAWRTHGLAAHRALAGATTGRYDGATVVRTDASAATLPTVARLARDYLSPEPIALALSAEAGALAAAATEPVGLGEALRTVAADFGGTGWGTPTRGAARFDGDATEVAAAVRGAL
ncbi:hypothetical protein GCM10027435_15160 [Haloparvum alkalitolerans]